ncbi:hypothetical protein H6P81_008150 [Aristolochia fimbriata]|uniref:Cytochrome P450 n=1 Tax=Aristolochia fimbriata TaxID=158543 RepID=A0AAV7F530_ARIFI|nr:hypothetical protein H6P81_008150 [Aristolochia fimbriata]
MLGPWVRRRREQRKWDAWPQPQPQLLLLLLQPSSCLFSSGYPECSTLFGGSRSGLRSFSRIKASRVRLTNFCMEISKRTLLLNKEAQSKPTSFSHNIIPRVSPLFHRAVEKYGKMPLIWQGTQPRVIILDPEMIKEVLSNKFGHFEKPEANPLTRQSAAGLAGHEGEKWAKRRRILNPAFHLEKIKACIFCQFMVMEAFYTSCIELISKWDEMVDTRGGSCEVDVLPEFQNLTGDVISRTAYGSNCHEGSPIFKLQSEQAELFLKALFSPYFPGLQ